MRKEKKNEILNEIKVLTKGFENSIKSHPKEIWEAYSACWVPYLIGVENSVDSPIYVDLGLLKDEVILINKYIYSSSFISAWYFVNGDKEKQNGLTHSCITILESLGWDPKNAMSKYVGTERTHRKMLADIRNDLQQELKPGCLSLIIIGITTSLISLKLILFLKESIS